MKHLENSHKAIPGNRVYLITVLDEFGRLFSYLYAMNEYESRVGSLDTVNIEKFMFGKMVPAILDQMGRETNGDWECTFWIEESIIELDTNMLCVCGHTLEDHHVSWFPGGGVWAEECEYYGSNEVGGAKKNEETGRWEDHCMSFRKAS